MKTLFRLFLVVPALVLAATGAAPGQASRLMKEVEKQTQILKTSKNPEQRVAALNELIEIANVRSSYVQSALPAVVAALKDADVNVRRTAVGALGEFGPNPAMAVPALLPLLAETEDRTVRIAVANLLQNFGTASEPALPPLMAIQAKEGAKAEGQRDNDLLNTANQSVQNIQAAAVNELNYFVDTLKNPEEKLDLRLACVAELIKTGKKRPNFLPQASAALGNALLRDPSLEMQKTLVQLVKDKEIDAKQLAGPLAAALANDQEPRQIRVAAAVLLGTFRADAVGAMPVLTDIKAKEEAKEAGQRDQELLTSVNQAVRVINLAAPPKPAVKTAQ